MIAAAGGRPCWDNGARRAHGPQAGLLSARAAWIAGFAGTSLEDAGARYGMPVMGTIAHAWVMEFGGPDGELDAFRAWLDASPEGSVLLIDTYDVLEGAQHAMQASRETGVELTGVRIDRDPLGPLSVEVREALDAGGFSHTQIYLSGDLDEHVITDLLAAPHAADVFAIGTRLAVVEDAPATGAVYKTVERHADDGPRYVAKRHGSKPSIPGAHQAWRGPAGDVLCLADETWPLRQGMRPLLEPAMRAGVPVGIGAESLQTARDRCALEVEALPASVARLVDPEPLGLAISDVLLKLMADVHGPVPA
jgi:nicotinate phosphoribosyltransferase